MTQCVGPRDPHRRPTQGTHTGDPHRGPTQRGPTQGTHTGDPHRGEGPTEDPPPEGRATQGTHTGHTDTCDLGIHDLFTDKAHRKDGREGGPA